LNFSSIAAAAAAAAIASILQQQQRRTKPFRHSHSLHQLLGRNVVEQQQQHYSLWYTLSSLPLSPKNLCGTK